jgi:hypothetical protein
VSGIILVGDNVHKKLYVLIMSKTKSYQSP